MFMPDVNVLVYAHRADLEGHQAYERWLTSLVDGDEPFALSALVAIGFVRVVTHPRFPDGPTPLPVALAAIEQLTGHPRCHGAIPGPTHVDDVVRLSRAVGATGKHVADAQHAAIAISEGATWVTRDADFSRFEPHGLRWQHLVPD
jgi:hypothetical protein